MIVSEIKDLYLHMPLKIKTFIVIGLSLHTKKSLYRHRGHLPQLLVQSGPKTGPKRSKNWPKAVQKLVKLVQTGP